MFENLHSTATRPADGFPHLPVIKESIRLLYKQLSPQRIKSFSKIFSPAEAVLPNGVDIVIAVQMLASAIVRHLQLPKACVIVTFRDMENPGRVELTPEDDYLVDLHSRYRNDHRDIAAVLAHEITHVFLHRHGIRFSDTLKNELLTDTTAVYLGVGWLCLNAHRVTVAKQHRFVSPEMLEVQTKTTEEKLGYLTPEEFGYVMQKRAFVFGEKVTRLITSAAAKSAFKKGSRLAFADRRSTPVVGRTWWPRWNYHRNRRFIWNMHRKSGLTGVSHSFGSYRFEISDSMRVIFECPVCSQQLRLPTEKRVVATCGVCESAIDCKT